MSEQQLDPKVTAVLDKHFENTAASGNDVEDVDEDDLFAELEKDDSVLDGLRAQRLQQLHEEYVYVIELIPVTCMQNDTDHCLPG